MLLSFDSSAAVTSMKLLWTYLNKRRVIKPPTLGITCLLFLLQIS